MGDFEWVEIQCEYTEMDVKYIMGVCRYFGHKTIQSYVDKLKDIKGKHIKRINDLSINDPHGGRIIKILQKKIDVLDKRLPLLQLMAKAYPYPLNK